MFSNKVNKPGRCHNLVNRRKRQGNFAANAHFKARVIWYCLYRAFDKFVNGNPLRLLSNEKFKTEKRP